MVSPILQIVKSCVKIMWHVMIGGCETNVLHPIFIKFGLLFYIVSDDTRKNYNSMLVHDGSS